MARSDQRSDFGDHLDPRYHSAEALRGDEKDQAVPSQSRGGSSDDVYSHFHARENDGQQRPSGEPRTSYRDREHTYALRASEIRTLRELGTFRVVDADALAEFAYDGNNAHMRQDLKNLARQSLIARRNIEGPQIDSAQILTLTKAGQRFLSRQSLVPKNRPVYHGVPRRLTREIRTGFSPEVGVSPRLLSATLRYGLETLKLNVWRNSLKGFVRPEDSR